MANIITWYYLVPCRLSTDPKIRDLECPFYVDFHYYEQHFQKLFSVLTVEPIYRIFFVVSHHQ